nr:unnamed protein product [Callosobruchus analis]
MESFLHGVFSARNTYNSENVENSMDEQETEANEENSLTGSASVTGNGGTYTDIQTGVDTGGTDSNEIVATTESASADKEGGIGDSTNRYQNHFKIPVGGVKKYKRKAVEMNETERRMEEAYEIMKQCRNAKPPKPTLCTAYGQLVATRLGDVKRSEQDYYDERDRQFILQGNNEPLPISSVSFSISRTNLPSIC